MFIEGIKNKCCGCRTCVQKCSLSAIKFIIDKYGFEYPVIDSKFCVNCGMCETVCPIINDAKSFNTKEGGIAFALDEQIKYNGSSGGLFGVFAETILSEGGVVFGAAFDDKLQLKTTKAEKIEELVPLYKSKYLLCDTSFSFRNIEKELKCGKKVLYCSSPCQIAALKLYLKSEYDNLVTIDFVCHGVGSQTLFDRSIRFIEQTKKVEIKKFIYRYKKAHASSHYYYYFYLKDNKPYEKSDLYITFPYYNAYCKQLVCRDCCYDCKFASQERVGDITIGDFHNIEKYYSNIDRFAGVSMFLINTEKGYKLFDSIKGKVYFKQMDTETLYKNNRFSNEVSIPSAVLAFRESIANESFEITVKRFLKPSKDLKKLIYYKAPRFVRKLIMKLR